MTITEPTLTEPAETSRCQNCGLPLLGDHCYRCGQPVRGLVRHFSSFIGDFFDSVFELDGRIVQTIGPLLLRPGFLSTEYFAGRRVRYVSPVRLFVFLSLLAFFVAQFGFDLNSNGDASGADALVSVDAGALASANSEAELIARRDQALAQIAKARAEVAEVPGLAQSMAAAERQVMQAADRRLVQLQGAAVSPGGSPTASENASPPSTSPQISFGDRPWDAQTNPIKIAWLPAGVNDSINHWVERGQRNIERIQKDPNQLKDAVLSALPSTLFILMPLFALLLKITFLFKRRLYMEHLIVALHSHAFLFAALFLMMVFGQLADSAWHWLAIPARWLEVIVAVWMPVYLLLMQKRVYGQGWLLTGWNYTWLGMWYMILLSIGITATLLFSLVAM